jgi:hypothetical protein
MNPPTPPAPAPATSKGSLVAPPPEGAAANLQALMCVMDLAEHNRNKLQESKAEEDPEQIEANKVALAQQLREHYAKQGIQMPEEAIAEAVDEFCAGQSRFQCELKGFNLFLAGLYIQRARVLGIAAVVAALAAIIVGVAVRQDHARRGEKAEAVRQKAAALERQISQLEQAAATVNSEQARFESEAKDFLGQNAGVGAFDTALRQWKKEAVADSAAERQGLESAAKKTEAAKREVNGLPSLAKSEAQSQTVAEAGRQLDPIQRVIDAGRARLATERLALKAWSNEEQQARPSPRFESLNPVEAATFTANLKEAREDLDASKYTAAEKKLAENQTLLDGAVVRARTAEQDAAKIAQTSASLKALLARVRAEASEDAKPELEQRIIDGQLDQTSGDLALLTTKLKSLQQIESILTASFRLRLARNAPRGLTGIRRTQKQGGGHQWYLIVDAVGDQNQAVRYPVTSVETGQTTAVSMWGEAVPDSLIEEIRKEKQSRGFIANPEFGTKRRGALKIEYKRIENPAGQITAW